jgi:histidinol-phosphatase (PHP family)
MQNEQFIWETHGIHTGTGNDPIKHGIDDIEAIVEKAISMKHPNITFIIHTPRLTKFRYQSEEDTNIKFIRGSEAYQNYEQKIEDLRKKYGDKISIRCGIELEWLGYKLGLHWNRSKVLQVPDVDFVIGSVHFSREGIPYDGSLEEAQELLKIRGSLENYWAAYFEEMIEMVSYSAGMIHIVGHLDLPKLNVEFPKKFSDLDNEDNIVCDRIRVLLEIISENNFALDLNLAGLKIGCGIYPNLQILKRAKMLKIPISIGTDTHKIDEYGKFYGDGIAFAKKAGFSQYISFARGIPQLRSFNHEIDDDEKYNALNLSIEMLNRRFPAGNTGRIPRFSFGGKYSSFTVHDGATNLGSVSAIRIRRDKKSIMIGSDLPEILQNNSDKDNDFSILSKLRDKPGVLSILFNTLASEGINVKTAFLNSETEEMFLTVSGDEKSIRNAIEFAKGTGNDSFTSIEYGKNLIAPLAKKSKYYLLEMDGVKLPMPISKQMILAVIKNKPGVLLILLSALASRKINIIDLQLGERSNRGFVALSVEGNFAVIDDLMRKLGEQYYEISHFELVGL